MAAWVKTSLYVDVADVADGIDGDRDKSTLTWACVWSSLRMWTSASEDENLADGEAREVGVEVW